MVKNMGLITLKMLPAALITVNCVFLLRLAIYYYDAATYIDLVYNSSSHNHIKPCMHALHVFTKQVAIDSQCKRIILTPLLEYAPTSLSSCTHTHWSPSHPLLNIYIYSYPGLPSCTHPLVSHHLSNVHTHLASLPCHSIVEYLYG